MGNLPVDLPLASFSPCISRISADGAPLSVRLASAICLSLPLRNIQRRAHIVGIPTFSRYFPYRTRQTQGIYYAIEVIARSWMAFVKGFVLDGDAIIRRRDAVNENIMQTVYFCLFVLMQRLKSVIELQPCTD